MAARRTAKEQLRENISHLKEKFQTKMIQANKDLLNCPSWFEDHSDNYYSTYRILVAKKEAVEYEVYKKFVCPAGYNEDGPIEVEKVYRYNCNDENLEVK